MSHTDIRQQPKQHANQGHREPTRSQQSSPASERKLTPPPDRVFPGI